MIQRLTWRWYGGRTRLVMCSLTGGRRETSSTSSFGKNNETNACRNGEGKRERLIRYFMLERLVLSMGLASRWGSERGFPIRSMNRRRFAPLGTRGDTLARTM